MVYYEDLFYVKYKERGRSIEEGLDCYGFVLELCRRNGTPLQDILNDYTVENCKSFNTNLRQVDKPEYGDIMETPLNGGLHVGFMLDYRTVIHMTDKGAQIVPFIVFEKPTFYRIEK